MGNPGYPNNGARQRPPITSGDKAAIVPFTKWASRNRLKVTIAVVGGIVALSANSVTAALLKTEPSERPRVGSVRIETGDDVCWTVALGLVGDKRSDCGDGSLTLRAESGDEFHTTGVEGKFFASVTKRYRTDVNTQRVTIVLVVGGLEVDRASTILDTATVAY